jgi:hypothetical protein
MRAEQDEEIGYKRAKYRRGYNCVLKVVILSDV